MTRIVTILLLAAATAAAGKTLTLKLADGKTKTASVVSFDEEGVTISQGDKEARLAWGELAPASAYEARLALTPYDDGTARLDLSGFARGLQLYPEALEQLEHALALGALDEAEFEKREAALEREEIDFLSKRIDALLKTEAEPETCLAAIKRLKERYPDHERTAEYAPHIARLVEILAQRAEEENAAKEKAEDDAETAELRKLLGGLEKEKTEALARAAELRKEGAEAVEKAQVSRVRKRLDEPRGAVRYYKEARKILREMARADKQFRIIDKEDLRKQDDALEKEIVECYLQIARTLLKQRNYKGAKDYVIKILHIDPINEEALDMVKEIQRNRISFKASDITNARPRVTSG